MTRNTTVPEQGRRYAPRRNRGIGNIIAAVLLAGFAMNTTSPAAVAAPNHCETNAWESITSTIPEARLTDSMRQQIRKGPDVGGSWDLSSTDGFVIWAMAPRLGGPSLLPKEVADGALPLAKYGFATRYSNTPVGPYNEITGMLSYARLRDPGMFAHSPFMVVDSPETAKNGRNNWGFPKSLADFVGTPRIGETLTASGEGWSVSVSSKPLLFDIHMTLPEFLGYIQMPEQISFEQPSPACGTKKMRSLGLGGMSGSVQVALITVKTEGSDELRALLPSGVYPGGYITFDHLGFDKPGMN
ncbi:acetoacetate decarboxylase family protein [Nocardia sp. NPDC052316]|uniref:acetoacetate decarboxylase family protein n=1 Tax=Nocardia sp. NPDC052316 TaxID=3364329 RepID=UPI0037CBFEBC